MSFFDWTEIERHLVPLRDVVWFRDAEPRPLNDAIRARLASRAARWENYGHPEYGDSYGEFQRNRNRCNFEDMYINRRWALADFAFYEYFIGGGKYIDRIAELAGRILNEDTWCVPAHANRPEAGVTHILELYAAETASVLSLAHHFLGERLPAGTRARIAQAVRARMFVPFTETDAYSWMGASGKRVNNWNPWIHSNVLFCAALLLDDGEFRRIARRALGFTENYLRGLPADGSCDEGARYWNLAGACVFDIVEMLYDLTGGAVDYTKADWLYGICNYPACIYDASGQPANFGDATIDFYPDAPLLARAGERTGNAALNGLGRFLYRPERLREIHDNFYRQMKDVLTAAAIEPPAKAPDLPPVQFLEGIQVCTMRKNGFFLCFKGHHNGESHNHNDAGSFVVYQDGMPLLIDPGVDLYSGFTFGPDRYRLWTMRSDYHNLPVIDGHIQHEGEACAAGPMRLDGMRAQAGLSGAYGLEGRYVRTVSLEDDAPAITDEFSYAPDRVTLHYMTREKPEIIGSSLRFSNGTRAIFSGVTELNLEEIDLTGQNPPDGIRGDAPNRRTGGPSALLPRLLTRQWGQDVLCRVTARCSEQTVRLTFVKAE